MRSLTPPPYLTALARTLNGRRALLAAVAAGLALLAAASVARAASVFYIRGAGDGHGIGLSQYGAEGYALHGADYQAILAHYYTGSAIGQTDPAQVVRVLLGTGRAAFTAATGAGRAHLSPATTYTVSALRNGRLALRTDAGKPAGTFPAPLVVTGPGPLQVPGLGAYRGSLVFSPDGHGGVQTVNDVGLDDYVEGVVAEEMPASWAPAALQAQAVAARTYAITTTVNGNGYDLYDDTRSQVYGGVDAETPATDAAVAATSGQVVTYNGQPAVTYFFSSSGGHTESIQDAWPGATPEPWLVGVPDPYDGAAGNPYHRWGLQMSVPAAARKLRGLVKGGFVGIRVTRHGTSPRIVTAEVVGTRGQTEVSGGELQSAFGLYSTWAAFTTISTLDPRNFVSGRVYPAPRRSVAFVQAWAGRGWRTVRRTGVSPSGYYRVRVPPGRYRIVYASLPGPAVIVR